jgi:hypothetical protein
MSTPARQALRIAVISEGRILEDRTLPVGKRAKVTVGADPRATFSVPTSEATSRVPLFEVTKAGPVLVAAPSLEGRVAVSGRAGPLSEQPRRVPLAEGARGRVRVGDVVVLFHLVTPPPAAPGVELPRGARSLIEKVDRSFVTVLAVVFAVHFAAAGYVASQPAPVEPDPSLAELERGRFGAVLLPLQRPAETPVALAPLAPGKAKPARAPPRPASSAEPQTASKAPPKPSGDALKERVSHAGLLVVIGARGEGDSPWSELVSGDPAGTSVAAALRGAGGAHAKTAAEALRAGFKGDDVGGTAQVDPIGTSGARAVELVERRETAVTGRVREEPLSVDVTEFPADALAAWVRARRGAIQSCYERALKRNPTLSGRLVLRFSITPRGRVTSLDLSEGTLGDAEVSGCIATIAQRWVLPFTPDDEVAVAFPFVFTASK